MPFNKDDLLSEYHFDYSKAKSNRFATGKKQRGESAEDANEPSRTDWVKLDKMTDEDIDLSDNPELDDDFFERATLHIPHPPKKK